MKRNKTLPIAVSEDDLEKLDKCRNLVKVFPPSRSPLACTLLRYAMDNLLNGKTKIQNIYQKYGVGDAADIGRAA